MRRKSNEIGMKSYRAQNLDESLGIYVYFNHLEYFMPQEIQTNFRRVKLWSECVVKSRGHWMNTYVNFSNVNI